MRRLAGAAFPVLFALLAAAPLAAWADGNQYLLTLATRAALYALAAVSLQIVVGFAGLPSLGHAAFLGIGAYVLLILGTMGADEAAISLPAAMAASALFAWPTGLIALRTSGVAFLMTTLAFGQMAFFMAESLAAYGGSDGMALDRAPPLAGSDVLGSPLALHGVALAALLAGVLLAHTVGVSRFGRASQAARDSPARTAALGFDVRGLRLAAYVGGGTVCGLAGWLLATASGFVGPAIMDWRVSGELLVMVILGGAAMPQGAAAGAIGLVLVEEGLAAVSSHGRLLLGALLLLAALARLRRRR